MPSRGAKAAGPYDWPGSAIGCRYVIQMRAELLGVGTDIASARKVAFSLMPSLLGLVRLLQCGAGAGAEGQEGLGSDLRQVLLAMTLALPVLVPPRCIGHLLAL